MKSSVPQDYVIRIESGNVSIKRTGKFWSGITIYNTLEAWEQCVAAAQTTFPNQDNSQLEQTAATFAWSEW